MDTDLHQMIGRIDERTELMLKSMHEFREAASDHDRRISSLEGDRNKAKGALYVVGIVSGGIGAFIGKIIGAVH